jgi:hypothetical protein
VRQTSTDERVIVRPFARLLWQVVLAVVLFCGPIVTTALVLTVPDGPWFVVVVFVVLVLIAIVLMFVQFSRTRITATDDALIEHTILGKTVVVPMDSIASVVMLEMHRSMASESRLQLFVLDKDDRWILRMRGEYWTRDDIEKIAARVTVPIERQSKPVTLTELQLTRPAMLYWFERSPLSARR